ncbi:MAG: dioxygenase [Spirochaetales bacterium]|nr:dioxygenase [Spirochaetales bacterium]
MSRADKKNGQIVYFSHGGGPMPLLGDTSHRRMISFLENLTSRLKKPEEILVISAHWEEAFPTVIGQQAPPLFYDYYGFPESTYDLTYPAPGNPKLAGEVTKRLKAAGIKSEVNKTRGFDHGLFVPLLLMYPQGKIPCTQISLKQGLDPKEHLLIGKALKPLLERKILIIGSGFSFHNMQAFSWGSDREKDGENDAFQDWLAETCTGDISAQEREKRLIDWEKAPHARYCHPREEHLLPLHVCAGLAEEAGEILFDDYILGKRSLGVGWL